MVGGVLAGVRAAVPRAARWPRHAPVARARPGPGPAHEQEGRDLLRAGSIVRARASIEVGGGQGLTCLWLQRVLESSIGGKGHWVCRTYIGGESRQVSRRVEINAVQ